MIALLVLALGILGISKLQSTLIQNGSYANERTIAVSIAQQKIDDLKSYSKLGSGLTWTAAIAAAQPAEEVAYEHVTGDTNMATYTETGGVILPSSSITVGPTNYSLNWSVEDYWYEDGDVNPSTLLTHTSTEPIPAPARSDFKLVTVIVGWDDVAGDGQRVSLNTVIDAYSLINTSFSDSVHTGGNSPIIPYTPLAAPDVIPVTLNTTDGLKKETNKPLPDVSKKGFSTTVSFETVTYNTNLDTVKREEFRTVACRCGSGSVISTHWYGQVEWDEQNLKLKDTITYDDFTSVSNSVVDDGGGETQALECATCCADGPDVAGTVFKSCRLKRIDGVLRYFKPWKLIAFNIIPASFFDATSITGMDLDATNDNITEYSNYITALVRAKAGLSLSDFESSTADIPFSPVLTAPAPAPQHLEFTVGSGNERQLQVRAVYMDYPSSGYTVNSGGADYTAANVPLDRVSFYEVNLTQLAGWTPDRNETAFASDYTTGHDNVGNSPGCNPAESAPSTRNYVTNDALENGCESTFSRGEFFPVIADISPPNPTTVEAIIYTSNDGIVDSTINNEATVTSTLDVTTQ